MENCQERIDILSILSTIELEAASDDEFEAYLFQEAEGSIIFQAGGKEHRNWKSKFETCEAAVESSSFASVPSPCKSSFSSSSAAEIPCEVSTDFSSGRTVEICTRCCYESSDSISDVFFTFTRDESLSPEGTDTSEHQQEERVKPAVFLQRSRSFFHKEIESIMAAQTRASVPHGHRSIRRSIKKQFLRVNRASCMEDDADSASVSDAHPIQAIGISLRRWIDFLENHDVSASYNDLVQLHFFAQRFRNLVEFFLFSPVDILLGSSRIFDASILDLNEGIIFPPLSSLILQEDSQAPGEEEVKSEDMKTQTVGECSSELRSSQNKTELQRLQEWLMDGIDYLENGEIVAHYQDCRLLHTTTKQLLELVESYFTNLVDQLLNHFAFSIGVNEPVCASFP